MAWGGRSGGLWEEKMALDLKEEEKSAVQDNPEYRGQGGVTSRAEARRQTGAWRDSSGRGDRKYRERTSSHGSDLPGQEEGFRENLKQERRIIT